MFELLHLDQGVRSPMLVEVGVSAPVVLQGIPFLVKLVMEHPMGSHNQLQRITFYIGRR
jgi:hypothetical protein